MGIIEHQAGAHPWTSTEKAERCIRCGHCMAVCPAQALLLDDVAPNDLLSIDGVALPTPVALDQLMRARRSIRRFSPQPVERDTIAALLDVARYAPTGKNTQPLRFTVVSGQSNILELSLACVDFFRHMTETDPTKAGMLGAPGLVRAADAGKDRILHAAPHVVIAHGPARHPMLAGSAMIALSYLELAAAARGLGACWAGYLQIASVHQRVQSALRLPAGDAVAGALMLGKSKVLFRRIPPRKPLEVNWVM